MKRSLPECLRVHDKKMFLIQDDSKNSDAFQNNHSIKISIRDFWFAGKLIHLSSEFQVCILFSLRATTDSEIRIGPTLIGFGFTF